MGPRGLSFALALAYNIALHDLTELHCCHNYFNYYTYYTYKMCDEDIRFFFFFFYHGDITACSEIQVPKSTTYPENQPKQNCLLQFAIYGI